MIKLVFELAWARTVADLAQINRHICTYHNKPKAEQNDIVIQTLHARSISIGYLRYELLKTQSRNKPNGKSQRTTLSGTT